MNSPFLNVFIDGSRIRLRSYCIEDMERIYEIANKHDVLRFLPPSDNMSLAEWAKCFAWQMQCYEKNSVDKIIKFVLGIEHKESGILIGWCGLGPWDPDESKIEVLYGVDPDYWGKGLATEAVQGLISYGFDNFHLKEIVGSAQPENIASCRVLEKVGMTKTGIVTEVTADNEWYKGEIVYSITKKEWHRKRQSAMLSTVKIQMGLTHEEAVLLDECLYQYNVPLIGRDDIKGLSLGKYDAATNDFLGGARSTTYWDWMRVTEIWCDPHSYGKHEAELLDQLEVLAAARGCHSSWVSLMDWESVDLFRSSGYVEFGRLPEYATGHDQVFLRKSIKGKQSRSESVISTEMKKNDLQRIQNEKKFLETSILGEYSTRLTAVSARAQDRLVGGAQGYVNRKWFYVDLMFVHESYRRKGVATAMLKTLEGEARIAGCKNINVETFFARDFYKANGFEVFGGLDGFAGKHNNYFLRKSL